MGDSIPAYDTFPGCSFDDHRYRNLAALRLLDSLFVYRRLSVQVCSWRHVLLICYFPIGIILLLLRILIGFPLTCCISYLPFPRSVHTAILRYELLVFFGINIRVIGSPAHDARIFVSNHISEFDAVAIRCIMDPVIFAYSFYEDMWWLKCTPVHIFQMVFVPPTSRTEGNVAGRDLVNKKIDEIIKDTSQPILVFPEGGLTNTPTGLLQYHKHTFGLGAKIQPIALTMWSPLPLYIDSAYASFLNNLLCVLFKPIQTFTIDFLPAAESINGESGLSFSRRVMQLTARRLGVLSAPFLYSDKKKWLSLKKRMMDDGYDVTFILDEEKQTVEVYNAVQKVLKPQVSPTVSEDCSEILLAYLKEQWKFDSDNFSHIIFSKEGNSTA